MTPTGLPSSTQERELIAAARGGDDSAYADLVAPYRSELQAHCYRMLGSLHDAEDALQDALLRAWKGLPRFAGRSSLRAWLYKIATNASLDAIARRPKRVLPIDHSPAADPSGGPGMPVVEQVWLEPYPDLPDDAPAAPDARYEQREGVELAFIAALQHLPASQRAVLILREVLGYSARETAELLDTTTASVNSSLQRARKGVEERLPERSQQATLRALGDEQITAIVENYVEAWERGDVDAVVSMLTEDAALTMPPLATWFRGRKPIAEFLRGWPLSGRWRWRHITGIRANGQAAIGCYAWNDEESCFRPFALEVLTLRGREIAEINSFVTRGAERPEEEYAEWPDHEIDASLTVFERFGLPSRLD